MTSRSPRSKRGIGAGPVGLAGSQRGESRSPSGNIVVEISVRMDGAVADLHSTMNRAFIGSLALPIEQAVAIENAALAQLLDNHQSWGESRFATYGRRA